MYVKNTCSTNTTTKPIFAQVAEAVTRVPRPEATKSGPTMEGNMTATPPSTTTRVMVRKTTKQPKKVLGLHD